MIAATRSVLGMRVAALLLAVIGLGPLLWSGVTDARLRWPIIWCTGPVRFLGRSQARTCTVR